MDSCKFGERMYKDAISNIESENYGLVDSGRVLHSFSFRRLQGKMQVISVDQGDFHRTRLTHSAEVASVARAIFEYLVQKNKIPTDLKPLTSEDPAFRDCLRAICMAHDIGHPPFGHAGERALNYVMSNYGGFEGNAQSLHLLTNIEGKYGLHEDGTEREGLNLSRRTLLGILKYPFTITNKIKTNDKIEPISRHVALEELLKPKKGYYSAEKPIVNWLINTSDPASFRDSFLESNDQKCTTFDCSLMDIADDISNSVHDLEDAIYLELISIKNFKEYRERHVKNSAEHLSDFFPFDDENIEESFLSDDKSKRRIAINMYINNLLKDVLFDDSIDTKTTNPLFNSNLKFSKNGNLKTDFLKKTIENLLIHKQHTQTIEFGGTQAIIELFNAFISNPKLLPDYSKQYSEKSPSEIARIATDYIAGMTDGYLLKIHNRLFGIDPGSIFDKL